MYDLMIIGAGPGGYEAAIRAAQHNMKVVLFEEKEVGGTCLNRGCIPTKALLHAAELAEGAKAASEWGIRCETQIDLDKLYEKKNSVVETLRVGVEMLLKQNGVEVVHERAVYAGEGRVTAGAQTYEGKDVLLAAGSRPLMPPIEGLRESKHTLTSDDLLAFPPPSNRLAILGGGVIGVEMAAFCLALGVEVVIIEAMPRILPLMDREISQSVAMAFKKKGAQIITGAKLMKVEDTDAGVALYVEGKDEAITAEKLLVSVGRAACTAGLFAGEAVTPHMEKGRIVTGKHGETSLPHLFAIGDITHGIQLAHAASAQGCHLADHLAGIDEERDITLIPSCVYLTPEIACVGLTEDEARQQGIETALAKYLMSGNGRTIITGSGRGFIKLVAEKTTGKLIGAQLMCERASDIIDECTLAIARGMTAQDMLSAVRPHPTFVEGLQEALESFSGHAIHVAPARKRQ